MLSNRYSKISTGLLILVVAFLSVSFINRDLSSIKTSGNARPVSANTYLPLPPGKQAQIFIAARGSGDFSQRHENWSWSASAPAYSDYFERHLELSNLAGLGQGASDYAARHPELSAPAQASVDLTDYYFRHISQ